MRAPSAGAARRPPIVAVVAYTLRTSLSAKRWAGILVPSVAAVLFGLIARSIEGTSNASRFAEVASTALFPLILPVTCLIVGDAVLGSEIRAGSFAFTWLSPVPTWQIALGRWCGGTIIAAACTATSCGLSAAVAGASGSAGSAALAAAFGSMAYVAVFIAIGCIARRAAVWSLAFVFLVERLLGTALAGIAQLSPGWEARAAFVGFVDGPADLVREGIPAGSAALVRLTVIAVVALLTATSRLSHLKLAGSSD